MNTRSRTVAFSPDATNIFFHITTRCNLDCRHCYINPSQHGTETLSLDTIITWLDTFAERGTTANIIFLGGEPTLHPELAGAVRHARSAGFGSITIDTNGFLFHDILDRVTPEDVDYFSFSLDGATPSTNDRLRGAGSHERCIAGIRSARDKGFQTSLIYTVSQANIHELPDMPPLLESLGISRFFIQVIGLRGKSAAGGLDAFGSSGPQLTRDAWLETVPDAARDAANRGLIVTYPKVYLAAGDAFECAGLVADNYFIFPNGRVYRCPLCEDYPVHSMCFEENRLKAVNGLTEADFFRLDIPEGCVMNKLIQPDNTEYGDDGQPRHRIACCLLKEEIVPAGT